jgi:hypothetical protein
MKMLLEFTYAMAGEIDSNAPHFPQKHKNVSDHAEKKHTALPRQYGQSRMAFLQKRTPPFKRK